MNLKTYRFDALLYFCNFVIANFPSARVRLWFYRTVMKFDAAPNSQIFSGQWIDCRGGFSIGENSVINQRCRLDNRGGIKIGRNVSISPEVHLITADHDIQDKDFKGRQGQITIGNYVFIGSRATILPGINIGEGSVVAACACVTKDVPPYTVVGGVPGTIFGERTQVEYDLNYLRHFF